MRPRVILLLGQQAAESFASLCGDSRPFKELLSSQGEIMPFGDPTVRRYVVPQPTAPYPGRSEIYGEVFGLVREVLKRE